MVYCWELRASAPADGALLLVGEVSLALLVLHCLLSHCLLLQWGPWGKGAVDDLVVITLTTKHLRAVALAAVACNIVM